LIASAGGDIDLLHIFNENEISYSEKIYLNWYRFDRIDEMYVMDVAQYFSDLWYPGADDIDVFDFDLNWIISVTHYGDLTVRPFSKQFVKLSPHTTKTDRFIWPPRAISHRPGTAAVQSAKNTRQ
jgi:hypothetical protein